LPGDDGTRRPRIPTQLLESALATVVLVLALAVVPVLGGHGAVFLIATCAYAAGRTVLEPTRERVQRLGRVSVNRAISGVLIAAAVLVLTAMWR